MIVDPVTARWGDALYNLAARDGVLPAVASEVEALSRIVSRPEVRAALVDPGVPRATRRKGFVPLVAGMSELARNLVNLLFDKGREEVLLSIGTAFRRRALAEKNQAEGVVESARPLDPGEIARIAEKIGRVLGKQLVLTNRVSPELIGGARVIAQNRMIDWSVEGRLDALRRQLLDARLPAASATR